MLSNGFLDYCQNGTDFVIRAKNRDYLLGYLDAMAYEVGKIVGRTVISENYFHITCTCNNQQNFERSADVPQKSLKCKCGMYFILYTDDNICNEKDTKAKLKFIMRNS